MARIPVRYIVGVLLVFLPFQDLVISRVPGSLVLPARYLPELVVLAIAVPLVLTRLPTTGRDGLLLAGVGAVVGLLSLTGFWNDVPLSTIAAGARSEFRFLPIMVVAMLSLRVRADARFYARVLLASALAQSLIATLEAVGGHSVRAIFAPSYTLVVEGVVVGKLNPPLDTIFGTFSHRNLLGDFLAFAAIVVVSAGPQGLGLRRRTVILSWLVLATGTLASASREGMIALIVGTAFVLSFQYRLPAMRLVLALGVVAGVTALAIRPQSDTTPPSGASSWTRWSDVVSARGWSATPSGNFRLYYMLETGRFVARDKPFAGFGLGTARIRASFKEARVHLSGSRGPTRGPIGLL